MKKRIIFYIILLTISAHTYANPVGWYDPQLLINNVKEYYVALDDSENPYIAYSSLLNEFKKDKPQNFSIELKIFDKPQSTIKLHTFSIPPVEVLFSPSPVVAAGNKSIMVMWQQPSTNTQGMIFKYVILNKSTLEMSSPKDVDIDDFNIFQPDIFVDNKDNFHLFFQKNLPKSGATSLAHSIFKNGTFRNIELIVKNVKSVGRGAFFPSILFKNGDIHIVYQSRQVDSFTDELYYIKSSNSGASFSSPERITENTYNDFSPSLYGVDKNIELVWQSNQSNNWQVYYSADLKTPERISTSMSNSYEPTIGYSAATGKVIAWYDQRVDPGQVFARFLNVSEDLPMNKEHQVTLMKDTSNNPHLLLYNKSLYLLFINNSNLYFQKADMETSPMIISSPTHPENKITSLSDIMLTWKVENEPSGIAGYAYLIDTREESIPDFYNLGGDSRNLFKKGLSGGNYFFHIKYKDKAGNESAVFNYPFSIDASNPVMAEINSPSHAANIAETKHDFTVNYSAVDDIGIKGYNYTLSSNRGAPLNKFTVDNELHFSNLENGDYYFLIQAIDKSGKASPIASYKIKIVPEDYNDFNIYNNITDGRVETDYLDISIQINTTEKEMLSALAILNRDKKDPFLEGTQLEFTNVAGIYKTRIPLPKNKWGLYTLSLGLNYKNGSKSSIRNLHFEYYRTGEEQPKIVYNKEYKPDITKKYLENPSLIEEIKPSIDLSEKKGLYKVTFSLPGNLSNLIKGYSYQISSIPRLPEGEINYIEDPVYIYDLSDGIYYLSVKPVYKDEKINRLSNYSYLRFVVKNKNFWQANGLWILALILILLTIVKMSRKLQFHLGKYT
ncbi:MAG: hypothetical protein OEV78_07855 [Spirochaetia bacterium]|nr:hypothetical protein [Spirochaetia bacterium]